MIHATGICYIVGAMSLTPALRPYPTAEDYVIAADRGYDSLMAYGVVPDLAVGDFDSLGYQSLEGLLESIGLDRDKVCTYCWNGRE